MGKKPNSKLRDYRLLQGLTQNRLGEIVDTDATTVCRWETGVIQPSRYYQEKLCKYFGKNAFELGFIEESSVAVEEMEAKDLDKLRRKMLKEALQLVGYTSLIPSFGPLAGSSFTSAAVEAFLPQWEGQLQTFRTLYFEGNTAVVEQFWPAYLSQITTAVKQGTKQQKEMARLVSQAYQLQWLLQLQLQDFGQAAISAKQVFLYGEVAEDPGLLLAALNREAHIYFHLKNPAKELELLERALPYASEVSPLLQSWLYLNLAEAYAHFSNREATNRFLDLARNAFPNDPAQDPNYAYYALNSSWFAIHEVTTHLHLQQPKVALVALDQFDKQLSAIAPQRVEMTNKLLSTYCALNELDAACETFVIAEQGARESGSNLRYNEVANAYFAMLSRWPKEKKVRKLREFFQQ